jgi:hypothetical protein
MYFILKSLNLDGVSDFVNKLLKNVPTYVISSIISYCCCWCIGRWRCSSCWRPDPANIRYFNIKVSLECNFQ